jgi:hypothetical protein
MHVLRSTVTMVAPRSTVEQKIIHHILWEGRDLRWTLYNRRNVAAELALYYGKHPDVVKRVLRRLVERGWLQRGKDSDGQPWLQLTPAYVQASVLADQRYKVRRAIGGVSWLNLNGDDELADKLHELALTMTQTRYKARVHAAVKIYTVAAGTTPDRKDERSPARGRKVSSKGTLSLLRGDLSSFGKGS